MTLGGCSELAVGRFSRRGLTCTGLDVVVICSELFVDDPGDLFGAAPARFDGGALPG